MMNYTPYVIAAIVIAHIRTKRFKAHINTDMMKDKNRINRNTLNTYMNKSVNDYEMNMMYKFQDKYNEFCLFPSVLEIKILNNIEMDAQKKYVDGLPENLTQTQICEDRTDDFSREDKVIENKEVLDFARYMLKTYSVDNRQQEHVTARRLAKEKQQQNGGPNEYDVWVEKYASRTTPEMKAMINNL